MHCSPLPPNLTRLGSCRGTTRAASRGLGQRVDRPPLPDKRPAHLAVQTPDAKKRKSMAWLVETEEKIQCNRRVDRICISGPQKYVSEYVLKYVSGTPPHGA